MLEQMPEAVYAKTVADSVDAVVYLRAQNIKSLENALERVRAASNVDHTRSTIVLSRLVNRYYD